MRVTESGRHIRHGLVYLLILMLGVAGTSCNSEKRLAKRQARQALEMAKASLREVISDEGTMTLTDKEDVLEDIRSKSFNRDEEFNTLWEEAETLVKTERAAYDELKRAEEEARKAAEREAASGSTKDIDAAMADIARKGLTGQANEDIAQLLKQFANDDVPVLIVISEENGQKDYDRPTTISKYLNWLKDQKRYNTRVSDIMRNTAGKIIELEVTKTF